jgi:hypothetical protein
MSTTRATGREGRHERAPCPARRRTVGMLDASFSTRPASAGSTAQSSAGFEAGSWVAATSSCGEPPATAAGSLPKHRMRRAAASPAVSTGQSPARTGIARLLRARHIESAPCVAAKTGRRQPRRCGNARSGPHARAPPGSPSPLDRRSRNSGRRSTSANRIIGLQFGLTIQSIARLLMIRKPCCALLHLLLKELQWEPSRGRMTRARGCWNDASRPTSAAFRLL